MNDTALPRYRFLSGFDFCVVDYELYCYPWLPCSKKRVRAVLRQFCNKKAAITGGGKVIRERKFCVQLYR